MIGSRAAPSSAAWSLVCNFPAFSLRQPRMLLRRGHQYAKQNQDSCQSLTTEHRQTGCGTCSARLPYSEYSSPVGSSAHRRKYSGRRSRRPDLSPTTRCHPSTRRNDRWKYHPPAPLPGAEVLSVILPVLLCRQLHPVSRRLENICIRLLFIHRSCIDSHPLRQAL